jgi:hypothetical protein
MKRVKFRFFFVFFICGQSGVVAAFLISTLDEQSLVCFTMTIKNTENQLNLEEADKIHDTKPTLL